jgi:hypothetical protein
MKTFLHRIFLALAICTVASYVALADSHVKKTVIIPDDTIVNGSLLKAGEYQLRFDEQTGRLEILRNGKVRATAPARIEHRETKARETAVLSVRNGAALEMIGIEVGGSTEAIMLNNSGAAGGSQ